MATVWDQTPISEIGLRPSTLALLQRQDIQTARDLARRTARELMTYGLISTEITEVEAILNHMGLAMAGQSEPEPR